jgi:hypothetical protein
MNHPSRVNIFNEIADGIIEKLINGREAGELMESLKNKE